MSVMGVTKELTDTLTAILQDEKIKEAIGESNLNTLSGKLESLEKELSNPQILSDVVRKKIASFEDWDERVKGLVEFVRPDETIIQFEIQSLTAAEMKKVRNKREAAEPTMPQPRQRGEGRPDPNDPHHKRDMVAYEEAKKKQNDLNILWILEYGLTFEIPGKDDDEKLEFLSNKVAGDADKIAMEIMEISNLTPETMRPFSRV